MSKVSDELDSQFWAMVFEEAGHLAPELERVSEGYCPEAVQEALVGELIKVIAWSNAGDADFALSDAKEACKRIRAELPGVVAEAKRVSDEHNARMEAILAGTDEEPAKPALH